MASTRPLRVTDHFRARLRERCPEVRTTEGALSAALAAAEWYPAGGRAYYALLSLGARRVALVVNVHEDELELVTLYEPARGWDRRLGAARPARMNLVLAVCA